VAVGTYQLTFLSNYESADVSTHQMYEVPLSGYHSSVEVQSHLLRHDTVSLNGKFSMLPKTLFSDCVTFDDEGTILQGGAKYPPYFQ